MEILRRDANVWHMFEHLSAGEQEQIIAFLRGRRGLSMMGEPIFRWILDPDVHAGRLEKFLAAVLGEKVKICDVLPRPAGDLVREDAVIMDITAELADGSVIVVELQKVRGEFTGEEGSCLVSDVVMREYERTQKGSGQAFSFRDLKPVYLIVLMENSTKEFRAAAPAFLHRQQVTFDSGAKAVYLSRILYISLDVFRELGYQAEAGLNAWLTFFSARDPATILQLAVSYPEFREIYLELKQLRQNPARLLGMYAEKRCN